jgi:hypothetical protein
MASASQNWGKIKALFNEALPLGPRERSALLERCLDQPVRAEVARLLSEFDQAGGFLSTPSGDIATGTGRKHPFPTAGLTSSLDSKRERFAAQCASLRNAEALFVEYPHVSHVRVMHIDHDSWGVKVEFGDSYTSGMHRLPRNPCKVAAAWIVFSFSGLEWEAQNVGWRFLFDPPLIHDCTRLATTANQNGATIAFPDYFKLFSEWRKNHVISGKPRAESAP